MILAATGHRPEKLGGYSIEVESGLTMLAFKHIRQLRPSEVISGMALGWDMAVAEATVLAEIQFAAAVPFNGQDKLWPLHSRHMYQKLLDEAASICVVSPGGFEPWKMHARNKWMVKHADHLLALWDGSPGGTANCIKEAEKRHLPITNVWEEWSKR